MTSVFLSYLASAQAAAVEDFVPGSSCSAVGAPEATSALVQKVANRVHVNAETMDNESAAEDVIENTVNKLAEDENAFIEDTSNFSGIASSDSGDYQSSYHTTNWNDLGNGRVIYFDRHDVSCKGNKGALQGFKLERNPNNLDQIRYNVKCSEESTWVDKNDMKSGKTQAKVLYKEGYLVDYWSMLKNKHVQCDDGYVLNRFQLRTMHPPPQTWTDIIIQNFRVAFDIIDALYPDTVDRSIWMWYEYDCVRVNTQNFQSQLVHWGLDPQYYCQGCNSGDQGYDSMYLDRSNVMAPNNGLMTEFWSY